MVQPAHRNDDLRACGAGTVVTGQNSVFTNGRLASVDGDPDSHGEGKLIARCKNVYINGKLRVIVTNHAQPDDLCAPVGPPHCDPIAVQGSPNVFIGEG